MENETDKQVWVVPLSIWAGLFLFFLLISLVPLRSAWIAAFGHGFSLKFDIAIPWVFCLLAGANLFISIKHGKIDRNLGGMLLTLLGLIVQFAYEAMAKLGTVGY